MSFVKLSMTFVLQYTRFFNLFISIKFSINRSSDINLCNSHNKKVFWYFHEFKFLFEFENLHMSIQLVNCESRKCIQRQRLVKWFVCIYVFVFAFRQILFFQFVNPDFPQYGFYVFIKQVTTYKTKYISYFLLKKNFTRSFI